MSIGTGVVVSVTLQKVNTAPHTKAAAQGNYESLKNIDSRVKEIHIQILPESEARRWPQTTSACFRRSFQKIIK